VFTLHNGGTNPRVVNVCAYDDLGLAIDTESWDPRESHGVPTLAALQGVHAEPGHVELTWYGGSASGMSATVYRRTRTSTWSARSLERFDATGRLVYTDREVQPGTEYGYRLGLTRPGGAEVLLDEAWVEIPTGFHLALQGTRPNPVERDLVVAFALRDAAPAKLELIDVNGRSRWARVVTLAPGNHVLNLGRVDGLAPGVYLLRLTQGRESVAMRIAFIR
jgi:hypothetical protein